MVLWCITIQRDRWPFISGTILGILGSHSMRCYFLRGGQFAAIELLDRALGDDAAVRQAASMFIAQMGKFERYEIWDQNRMIFRFPDAPLPKAV
jgi:hypothetical protein